MMEQPLRPLQQQQGWQHPQPELDHKYLGRGKDGPQGPCQIRVEYLRDNIAMKGEPGQCLLSWKKPEIGEFSGKGGLFLCISSQNKPTFLISEKIIATKK